jgi:hypothetical protein
MRNIYPFLFALFVVASCGKSDTVKPTITFLSPTDNQSFVAGQTVLIQATITDNNEIHGVHLTVTKGTTDHLIHSEEHIDAKSYTLNNSFIVQSGFTYTIEIEADDHDQNTTTVEIHVTGQ